MAKKDQMENTSSERVIYSFRRHSDKLSGTNPPLSNEGIDRAYHTLDSILETGTPVRSITTSPSLRAQETGIQMSRRSGDTNGTYLEVVINDYLGETDIPLPNDYEKMSRTEIIDTWIQAGMLEEGRPMYEDSQKLLSFLESKSEKGRHEYVSHAPNIEALIVRLFNLKSISEIGGALDPCENVEIHVDPKKDEYLHVEVYFRGISKKLKIASNGVIEYEKG